MNDDPMYLSLIDLLVGGVGTVLLSHGALRLLRGQRAAQDAAEDVGEPPPDQAGH